MVLQSKRIGRFFMIGVYDYTVIATYLSLLLGLGGLYSAAQNEPLDAMLCLMLAGLLDAFDGRIARTKKDRTSEHRAYYLGVPVTASAVLAPLFYLLSLRFALNCAVVYALGLFLLGVLYITPIRVKKPQLRGVALLSIFGLGEFAVLLRVLTR